MTDRIKSMLELLNNKEYRSLRNECDYMLYPLDDFGFNRRSQKRLPGTQGNMTPNYKRVITAGFDRVIEQIKTAIDSADDESKKAYGGKMLKKIDEAITLAEIYRELAKNSGNERLYNALCKVPHKPAESFYEACVFIKLCVYMLRDEPNIIDPKINLRVNKDTPDEMYEFATLLTKQGLGFPQYCNDDVVVPGLIKLGYDPDDAIDYTVAACWEFIIPSKGFDIPNIRTMDFPATVNRAINTHLSECPTFDDLLSKVHDAIKTRCDELIESCMKFRYAERPMCSVFIDGCIESLTDMRDAAKYRNYGCHGLGIANAADALAAIKKNVYEDKTVTAQELLDALSNNFEGCEELRNLLKDSPKMGNNDDYVDDIATFIMDAFSKNLNNRDNGHGSVWRAGTGSAMDYFTVGSKCPATADGRLAGTPYSSSFSPSLDVKTTGILSVIISFTKYDMTNIINGGPLTLELHDTVLRNEDGIKKTAQLVKNFICLGGHQLQLNSINRDRLLDAQKHPEKYPNLIVRVWGWSGYFNELDLPYQEHVIRRTEFTA